MPSNEKGWHDFAPPPPTGLLTCLAHFSSTKFLLLQARANAVVVAPGQYLEYFLLCGCATLSHFTEFLPIFYVVQYDNRADKMWTGNKKNLNWRLRHSHHRKMQYPFLNKVPSATDS